MSESRTHTQGREAAPVPRSRRRLAQAALLWLALPMVDVVQADTTAVAKVLSIAALVVFGACFSAVAIAMTSSESPDPTRPVWVLITSVIAVLALIMPLLRRDIEWTCLQVYCTYALASVLPLPLVGRGIGAGVAMTMMQSVARGDSTHEVLGTALTVLGISMTALGLRKSRVLVRRLHDAQGEVARLAAVEERLRIARDLHDLVGHSLSLIVVKSELAGRLAQANLPAAGQEIADVEQVARQSLVEVRDAVTGYRQRSLIEELDDARSALAAADVDTALRPSDTPLPDEIDQLFGWAVREGVTNVIRHARATRCEITVRLAERTGTATLDIVDDGLGPEADDDGTGNGLAGLGERVEALDGRITTGPNPKTGRGFRLTVRVPLPVAEADGAEGDDARLVQSPPADASPHAPAGL